MAKLLTPSVITTESIVSDATSAVVGTALPASGKPKVEYFCKTAGQGLWFYDRLDNNVAGPTIYRHLLEQADREIRIWDPYLCMTDAELFTNISAGIDIKILSFCDATNVKPSMQDFFNEMSKLQKSNHFKLEIAVIDKSKLFRQGVSLYGKTLPHDRFLFIDDRAFIVGSSLQYHSVENIRFGKDSVSTTMIYEIKDVAQCTFLINEFNSYWESGSSKYKYSTMIPY